MGCWNALSGPFNNSWTINVIQPISTLVKSVRPQYARVNETVTYNVTLSGSHVNTLIDFNDGNIQAVPFCSSTVFVRTETLSVYTNYSSAGNYTAVVDASNAFSHVREEYETVYVQIEVPTLSMNSDNGFVRCPPGEVTFFINKTDAGAADPTDIVLNWTIPGLDIDQHYITLPHTELIIIPCFVIGIVTIQANVSNGINFVTLENIITVQSSIAGLSVLVTNPHAQPGEIVNIGTYVTQGWPVQFIVDFSDGSDIVSFEHDDIEDITAIQHINHTYTNTGNYTVTVTARNDVTESDVVVDSSQITIQSPISNITLTVEPAITVPGDTVTYTLAVPSSITTLPDDVHMLWSFGDGTIDETAFTQDLKDSVIRSYTKLHTLSSLVVGKIETSVVSSNLVSNTTVSISLMVQIIIEGLQIRIINMHAAIGEVVFSEITTTHGFPVQLSVDFSDGSAHPIFLHNDSSVTEIFQPLNHTYGATGNYTIFVTGSNIVTLSDVVVESSEIIIQSPISELLLTVEPMITAPGDIVTYTLTVTSSVTTLPDDVHMMWIYGDDSITENDYTQDLQDESIRSYTRSHIISDSAIGDIETSVYCSNLISNTTVTISLMVQSRIEGLEIRLFNPHAAIGEAVFSEITTTHGFPVQLLVDFSDGSTYPIFLHNDSSATEIFQPLNHTYGTSGNYTIEVTGSNIVTLPAVVVESTEIVIQSPISELLLTVEPMITAPGDIVTYTLTVPSSVTTLPDDVHMMWIYGDDSITENDYTQDLQDESIRSYTRSHIISDSAIGDIETSVYCSNLISNITVTISLMVQAIIEKLEIRIFNPHAAIGEAVFSEITTTHGFPVQLLVDFSDGSTPPIFLHNDSSATDIFQPLNHTYGATGNYTIFVTGSNIVTLSDVVVESSEIIIQSPISELTLAVEPSIIAVGETATYYLTVPNNVSILPNDIHMVWTYGDDTADEYTFTQQLQDDSIRNFTQLHTFASTALGNVHTTLYCYNLISNATIYVSLNIQERISGLLMRPVSGAPVASEVNFYVQLNSGSSVNIYFDFGDGDIEFRTIDRVATGGETITFTRAYLFAGTFDLYVSAHNNISNMETTGSVTIDTPIANEDFLISNARYVSLADISLEVDIKLIREDLTPSDINIKLSTNGGTDWSEPSVIESFPYTYHVPIYETVDIGTLVGIFRLHNLVTEFDLEFNTTVVQPLGSLVISGAETILTELNYDYSVILNGGTRANITIDLGDSSNQRFIDGMYSMHRFSLLYVEHYN